MNRPTTLHLLTISAIAFGTLAMTAAAQPVKVEHKTVKVGDLEIFYREAGPKDAPAILLLHGFPTSSQMFRNLIPALGFLRPLDSALTGPSRGNSASSDSVSVGSDTACRMSNPHALSG